MNDDKNGKQWVSVDEKIECELYDITLNKQIYKWQKSQIRLYIKKLTVEKNIEKNCRYHN